ncbi:gamma-glutamylcyclotransferase family protein [Nitratidesulfovibrio sp.]|uniref:gamma-glutamylcyclotransferase family protein n=1 Tax=Nitratidesulfovibrio sp. TaxID=2802297 RepID=UPI00333E4ED1
MSGTTKFSGGTPCHAARAAASSPARGGDGDTSGHAPSLPVQTAQFIETTQAVMSYGRPDRAYLFAYGSNMNPAQLRARCSTLPRVVAVARLSDHRLSFHGHTRIWDGGLETVAAAQGEEVWGVVLELTFTDLGRLDAWQDARLDGAGSYFHYPATVTDAEGCLHHVLLYKKDVLGKAVPPSREYLDFIARGAEEGSLPAAYLARLRAMPCRPASYPAPRYPRFDRGLLADVSCDTCGGGDG